MMINEKKEAIAIYMPGLLRKIKTGALINIVDAKSFIEKK